MKIYSFLHVKTIDNKLYDLSSEVREGNMVPNSTDSFVTISLVGISALLLVLELSSASNKALFFL